MQTFTIAAAILLGSAAPTLGRAVVKDVSPSSPTIAEYKTLSERLYKRQQQRANEYLGNLTDDDFLHSLTLQSYNHLPLKFLWDFFLPDYNCPLKERLGGTATQGDGGKWVCGLETLLARPDCVVYSFGSDGDTSFEQDIMRWSRCAVHVFDPTLSHVQRIKVEGVSGLTLHRFGLGDYEGDVLPTDSRYTASRPALGFPIKTLSSIRKNLGHDWIDVLKIDIEGGEWAVLEQLLQEEGPLPFTQLLIEFHFWTDSPVTRPQHMLDIMKRLTSTGRLRIFNVEPNVWANNNGHDFTEYAFLQVDDNGEIVRPQSSAHTQV